MGTTLVWFRTPAEDWTEALPVGKGRMGAMVFGGIETKRLQTFPKPIRQVPASSAESWRWSANRSRCARSLQDADLS